MSSERLPTALDRNKIEDELSSILSFFTDYWSTESLHLDGFRIAVSEAHTEGTKIPLKLTLEPSSDMHERNADFSLMLGKLRILSRHMDSDELSGFVEDVGMFHHYFLELAEPWKNAVWAYQYERDSNSITLYDKREARVGTWELDPEQDALTLLQHEIDVRTKEQMNQSFARWCGTLQRRAVEIKELLAFDTLIESLKHQIHESTFEGMRYHWISLTEKERLSQADVAILAFLVRFAVELAVRSHYSHLIPSKGRITLGKLFGQLQENGHFVEDQVRIGTNLNILSSVIHKGNGTKRKTIIEIKEYFRAIFAKKGFEFAI